MAWCEDGFNTLNELFGFLVSCDHVPDGTMNHAQSTCMNRVRALYASVPLPPFEVSLVGSLKELCGADSRFDPDHAKEWFRKVSSRLKSRAHMPLELSGLNPT